jgi:two-component system, NtrC family, sensor kinase
VTASLRYLAEAARGPQPSDAAEVVQDALAAMERINALVRKLVDAGRLAAAPSGGVTALAPVVAKALGIARAIGRGDVRFEAEVPPGLHVPLRAETLERILEVLLRNAAEAVPEGRGGRVEVRAAPAEGLVRVIVSDDGVGMTPEVLRRAFDPFFTTKPQGRGSGLGLAVARGLVESGGGSLYLESEPGRGTRAIVELPEALPER